MMSDEKTTVTVQLTDVLVTIGCPHDSVDTETIMELANQAVMNNTFRHLIPRWQGNDSTDGPVFEVSVEILDEPEIQDDDRENQPEEFSADLDWWQDYVKEPL